MAKKRMPNKAELLLGKNIKRLRIASGMTRLQLGRKINKKEQEIAKYESGEFVPLSAIEDIGEAFDITVQKRLIRRISSLRKLEIKTKIEQEGLLDLYNEAFPENKD